MRRKAFREVHLREKKETRLYFEKDVFTQRFSPYCNLEECVGGLALSDRQRRREVKKSALVFVR